MIPEHIDILLKQVDEDFKQIKSYKVITKTKIRSVILDLVSILDYSSNHIADISSKRCQRPHFPYAKLEIDIDQFEKSFEKKFPSIIKIHQEIYSLALDLQYFKTFSPWLYELMEFNNFNKHNGLTDVKSKDGKVYESLTANGMQIVTGDLSNTTVTIRNTVVDGLYADDIDFKNGSIEIVRKREVGFDFKITKDKKIVYGDKEIEIIPFLNTCLFNIHNFIIRLYKLPKMQELLDKNKKS